MDKNRKVHFDSFFIKTDITAIKVLESLILIGTGSYLLIYDRIKGRVAHRAYIFEQTITGIDSHVDKKILVHGENVITLHELMEDLQISMLNRFVYTDWILTAKFTSSNGELVFVSMHSEAALLSGNFAIAESSKSTELCACYCAHIVNERWRDLYVLSGTAYSEIFVWRPRLSVNGRSPVLYRLKGHKGVIFSIDYSERLQMVCSTSDDGKALFWPVKDIFKNNCSGPCDDSKDIVPTKEIQHRQRVFRCKFFETTLVTAQEDSSIKMWDCGPDFRNRTSTHQTGPVWCLDFCKVGNSVFSGGSDGGIVSMPIRGIRSEKISTEFKHRYKDFVSLNRQLAVGITDAGHLNVINVRSGDCKLMHVHEDLRSYGIVKKSHCGNLVCLAGMHGNLHLYRFENEELRYEVSCEIGANPKIFSLHWLSCETFLTCVTGGILILWHLGNENLTPIQFFQLPPNKERWSTSATYCGTNNILVGDRKGSLYLYNMERNHPVQVLKKVQPMGVTRLYFNQGNSGIVVLGRNAVLHKYCFDDKQERLSLVTKDKLPFSWLGAYYVHKGKEIVLGFSNDKFVVWNHTSRRSIFEDSCGGGHRLWDFHIDGNILTLIYQKVDALTTIEFDLGNEVRDVIAGFHGTETNCMKLIRIGEDPFCCVAASGGEDTTLRLCRFDFDDRLNGLSMITTIKSHLSSVRTIAYRQVFDSGPQKSYFLFSGGGRAQIILWRLDVDAGDVNLKEVRSYYRDLGEFESEIRIMDLVTTAIDGGIILFAGCSNGDVRIYEIDPNDPDITHVRTVSPKERCILKLFTVKLAKFEFLVTASTDGNLTFLNVTDFLLDVTSNADISAVASIKTNQSGINSYSLWYLNECKVVILTGGDDKAFTLNLIECEPSENVRITRLHSYTDESFHFAHITGVYITKDYFITASVDQKVIVYSWEMENDDFKVEALCKRYTSVTDLQGIDYVVNKDKLELILFGNGFEIFTISLG